MSTTGKILVNESDYVKRLKEGSHEAYTVLYEYYLPDLYAFIYSTTYSKDFAEEVVQETFVRLWENRASIKLETSFKSYLFTIARNYMLDEFRRQINHPVFTEYIEYSNQLQLSENTTEKHLDFSEFCVEFNKAKKKLSARQLEIFYLNKELGQSIHSVAIQLEIAEQSVRNQLSTALSILRKEMKNFIALFTFLFL
ncbi:MAG: sigma-70 family RNA polymerase sigma factor [Dysgonamonadaceae bacterium]|jgi:RNA polymerase sigma-70 factor (ECF subfamily)|nr:sigma-70 family RNA polymerase sigma factor [Dysgonamonadaceae bacterium]